MVKYNSRSPVILLKWVKTFINRHCDMEPLFGFLKNGISNLAPKVQELEALLDQLKLNRSNQQITVIGRNTCVENTLATTMGLIGSLRKNPNWKGDYERVLKIHMLPLKAEVGRKKRTRKTGARIFYNEECLKFIEWVKDFGHELANNANFLWVSGIDLIDLHAHIEKVDRALNDYNIVGDNYITLLGKIDTVTQNIRVDMKAIITLLKTSEDWTDEYAIFLDVHDISVPRNFTDFKPVARVKAYNTHVSVRFLKDGLDGINIDSRLQGESGFSFLGYAKRSPYRDPRPIISFKPEVREYRLTAVIVGKEIGHPSEIVSVHVGGKHRLKPVAWVTIDEGDVWVHFQKNGKKIVNVYTRTAGEEFTFLCRATDYCFKDPRPIIPGKCEIREYRLNFVWGQSGKEIGYPSDIVSITLGSV